MEGRAPGLMDSETGTLHSGSCHTGGAQRSPCPLPPGRAWELVLPHLDLETDTTLNDTSTAPWDRLKQETGLSDLQSPDP